MTGAFEFRFRMDKLFYILFSIKREASLLLSIMDGVRKKRISGRRVYSGYIDDEPVRVVFAGMGKKNIPHEIFNERGLVISSGVCGSLLPELKTGQVVLSGECSFIDEDLLQEVFNFVKKRHSGIKFFFSDFSRDEEVKELERKYRESVRSFRFSPELTSLIDEFLTEADINSMVLKTLTVPKIIKNEAQKVLLNRITSCGAVEMEDYHRAVFFREIGLNIISLRVVLDELTDDVPTFRTGFNVPNKAYSLFLKLSMASESLGFSIKYVINSLKNLK